MDRRSFLASGSAFALWNAEAADSVYIPSQHRVEDLTVMQSLMDEFAFASLITSGPDLRCTHLPVLLDKGVGKYGRLVGHVAKNNPQHQLFDGKHSALIVFQGPHRYISPAWYDAAKSAVPTWNFAVVHCSGKPQAFQDDAKAAKLLERLVGKFEAYDGDESRWSFSKLPDSYLKGMRTGIVPFEMEIESIEGKFKLGQERNAKDRAGVLAGLEKAKPERNLREFTAEHYRRLKLE